MKNSTAVPLTSTIMVEVSGTAVEFFIKIAIDFGKIEFIIHYHNGAIDTERFDLSRVETIEVSPGYHFVALETDVKYVLLGVKSQPANQHGCNFRCV